ncbi:MAG: transcriptional regulator [Ornithinimicrobium sp.]|uniref:transcriptional regulator n=1 Tax=Ornithinimicrobium sp. TaxID=1977084 RepID=UPI0026E0B976|nr:transcriptional regulator [Ornithinimicrobium sp.]MDO5741223.1 transcriptional regulator [Ornithinimicrobium sp.]
MSNASTFNEVIHARNRLHICALLAEVDSVDFATVQDTLGVSDYVVSKHLKVLVDAGYVRTHKEKQHGRARTWLSLTSTGRGALDAHLAELRRITGLGD